MSAGHDWTVSLFCGGELLVKTWNDGFGSVSTEIAVCKRRIDDPSDPATHMAVEGKPLPPQPWADLAGYTTPRVAEHQVRGAGQ